MLMLILALQSTDFSQARGRQNAINCRQRTAAQQQEPAIGVQATEPAAPALSAQEQMGVINAPMADPVTSAGHARAQTRVIVQQAAVTRMPEALQLAAPAVQLYECRRSNDRLPATMFGFHANGQQYVSCQACNVRQ